MEIGRDPTDNFIGAVSERQGLQKDQRLQHPERADIFQRRADRYVEIERAPITCIDIRYLGAALQRRASA